MGNHTHELTASSPAIDAREREEAGRWLQDTLVELVDLALTGKQLHWSVTGPFFRSIHLQLDELVESWRELGDTVAERTVAIGFMPDGRAHTVARDTTLQPVDAGLIEDHVVITLLTQRLAGTAERVRGRMDRLGELDPVSEDVLVEVVRTLEEQLWMIRTQLPR